MKRNVHITKLEWKNHVIILRRYVFIKKIIDINCASIILHVYCKGACIHIKHNITRVDWLIDWLNKVLRHTSNIFGHLTRVVKSLISIWYKISLVDANMASRNAQLHQVKNKNLGNVNWSSNCCKNSCT